VNNYKRKGDNLCIFNTALLVSDWIDFHHFGIASVNAKQYEKIEHVTMILIAYQYQQI